MFENVNEASSLSSLTSASTEQLQHWARLELESAGLLDVQMHFSGGKRLPVDDNEVSDIVKAGARRVVDDEMVKALLASSHNPSYELQLLLLVGDLLMQSLGVPFPLLNTARLVVATLTKKVSRPNTPH